MVWGNKNHEGGGKRTNEDNQRKKMSGADTQEADPPLPPPPQEKSFNSQQHVLLILLKDWADMLEDVRVEEVYTAVYDVAHKCAGLFHVMQDLSEHKTL